MIASALGLWLLLQRTVLLVPASILNAAPPQGLDKEDQKILKDHYTCLKECAWNKAAAPTCRTGCTDKYPTWPVIQQKAAKRGRDAKKVQAELRKAWGEGKFNEAPKVSLTQQEDQFSQKFSQCASKCIGTPSAEASQEHKERVELCHHQCGAFDEPAIYKSLMRKKMAAAHPELKDKKRQATAAQQKRRDAKAKRRDRGALIKQPSLTLGQRDTKIMESFTQCETTCLGSRNEEKRENLPPDRKEAFKTALTECRDRCFDQVPDINSILERRIAKQAAKAR